MADSTLVAGLATAGATVVAAAIAWVGNRRRNGNNGENAAVSLTKQLMSEQRRDLDRARRRIGQLENEADAHREEMDQLRHELEYAHARIQQLGGP